MAQENDNVKVSPYQHFEAGAPLNGAVLAYICYALDRNGYLAIAVDEKGIAVNGFDFDNPSAEVMRETVEVMRELVARFDALNVGVTLVIKSDDGQVLGTVSIPNNGDAS